LPGGELVLMLKTRSVDVTASPEAVLAAETKNLEGLDLLEVTHLLPFHQDHWAMQARKL
jgi:fibrillarin-like pre-rRNA processing protein